MAVISVSVVKTKYRWFGRTCGIKESNAAALSFLPEKGNIMATRGQDCAMKLPRSETSLMERVGMGKFLMLKLTATRQFGFGTEVMRVWSKAESGLAV